ncbi:MAG: elongation factor G [Chloroflexi bacterium]|nr:elongation factor G [Chloroflexota bacterium]
MQSYHADQIRNVVLLSHCGAGKTSLSEAMLFTSGAIPRLGKVDQGTTTSDYDPDEIKRRISINLSLLYCPWKDNKGNIPDAPGYADSVAGAKAGMRVAEGAIVVVCAASGVEVGTEMAWQYTEELSMPRLIFLNKMDRENADFYKVVDQVRSRFGNKCVPIQLPIGSHADFQGIADLIDMKAYLGEKGQEAEIPASMAGDVATFRDKLAEAVAETDDDLTIKYLDGQQITSEELLRALKKGIRAGEIVPILTGSALLNIGAGHLLNAISNYLPSPAETKDMPADEAAPLAALVFMTSADPYVGKVTHFRVYSGAIESNSQVWNANKGQAERIGQLLVFQGKSQETVAKVVAGDIGSVAKLAVTATSDTLTSKDRPAKLAPIEFPAPIYSAAIRPKTKTDVDKMGSVLPRLLEEDPSLQIRKDQDTAEPPKIAYKETITSKVQAEYKHKKQTGGHGPYGHVVLDLEPLPRGQGFEFADKVVGGAVPRNYIPAVEKGVMEGRHEGILARFPVVDVRVTLVDGSAHPVDSSEMSFKIAASQALKKGLQQGQPVLLEPIVHLQVTVPDAFIGDIIGDLNTKRARVLGMTPQGGSQVIEAQVPLAEVTRYAIDLRSITQGRGTYTMEFSRYDPVPAYQADKIIAARAAEKESQ